MKLPLSADYYFLLTVLIVVTSATRICSTCWPSEIFTQPAVGLEFGPSYGRAVFKWPNKTIEEVATIKGDHEYTAIMLEIAGFPPELEDLLRPRQAILNGQVEAATAQQSILGSLTLMAQQLKDKVDSALSPASVSTLGVTCPVFFEASHRDLIQAAVRRGVNFQPSMSYFQTNSAVATAAANGIGVCQCPLSAFGCMDEHFPENEMILAVDYSDVLLTTFLYSGAHPEDQGIIDTRQALPLQSCDKDRETKYWNAVATALQKLMSENMSGKRLHSLVLSGTRAGDKHLRDALQSGISALGRLGFDHRLGGSELPPEIETTLSRKSMEWITCHVQAAAQGVADLSWRQNMRTCIDPCSQWRLLSSC